MFLGAMFAKVFGGVFVHYALLMIGAKTNVCVINPTGIVEAKLGDRAAGHPHHHHHHQ